MHGMSSNGSNEKTDMKTLKRAIVSLMNYAKKYVVILIIALVFSAVSAVLAVLGPHYISDLTAEITNGIKAPKMSAETAMSQMADKETNAKMPENADMSKMPETAKMTEKAEASKGMDMSKLPKDIKMKDIPKAMRDFLPTIDIDLSAVNKIGFILVAIYGLSMILNYIQSFILNLVASKIGKMMRTDITAKINRMPLRYFDRHNFGDTLSRVTNDVDSVTQSLNMNVGTLVSAVATLIGCIVMMFYTEWRMALTAIGASVIGFVLMGAIMSKSQKYFSARQNSLANVNGHVEEYYAGQNIVRAYNAEKRNLKEFRKNNEELRKNTFKAEFLSGLIMPLMSFIGNFGYVAVCVVGAVLAFKGVFGFEVVVAFMIYIRIFTSPLGQIGSGFAGLQSAAAAGERVLEFLNEEELSDESEKTTVLKDVSGEVTFKNVHFGYLEGKTVIENFSKEIKPGQKVAIVGPTGAGKTTIVNLLMRFYEVLSGDILIDGVSLKDIKRENVHNLFGMVLQDTWLFEGTVRDNLTYGRKDVSDGELYDICCRCGLKHFIDTLPFGFDTVLSDNVAVSAGQKQLLTIARAMVEDAPLLILDEATSSVDTRTELKIQKAMNELTENRTSFVIAHRLSTVRDADLIIYMSGGDILESGTHKELMAKEGLYANLYNSQFVGAV
ncbi:MAG: ABC transporter ATP-binding protein/permease [Clostridia bacterium]|nr:ABC transporter ATP-binding protein/permease [Clostridia bacterium]